MNLWRDAAYIAAGVVIGVALTIALALGPELRQPGAW